MAEASIPVDLLNPGQVLACLGFMEAAEILLGDAEGGFDWSDDTNVRFLLSASGERNPFEAVLEFLAEAEPKQWKPIGYSGHPAKKAEDAEEEDADDDENTDEAAGEAVSSEFSVTFPAKTGDRMALPIWFGGGDRPVVKLDHWADGSSRKNFKLYTGNRSAHTIARAMLIGVHAKPNKKQKSHGQKGDLKTKGVRQLWEENRLALVKAPFDVLTPMGGSFNFDPRGAWTAIDAGYSPNKHKHAIEASPVVEFLAAWGLQNSRPVEFDVRQVRYAVWGISLPITLARAALAGVLPVVPLRRFRFELNLSGENKVVTFAEEEPSS